MRYFFKSILFCAILSIFSCTTKNEEKSLATYTFHIDNAVEFADSILSVSKEIVLDTSVVTQLTSNTNFINFLRIGKSSEKIFLADFLLRWSSDNIVLY